MERSSEEECLQLHLLGDEDGSDGVNDSIGGLDVGLLDLLSVDRSSSLERDDDLLPKDGLGLKSLGEIS